MNEALRQPRAETNLAAIWSLVFERPEDLALRQVLADALQEAGDGRGEFIALQLLPAEDRTAKQHQRELMVLAEQGSHLGLPGLPGLRRTLAFWRGLPSEVELRLLDVDGEVPELALLRRVVVRGCEGAGRILEARTWRSLERLEGVPRVALPGVLRAVAPRLKALLLAQPPTDDDLALVAQLRGLEEFGWAEPSCFGAVDVDLGAVGRLGQVTLVLHGYYRGDWPSPASLRRLLRTAPVVELRSLAGPGEVRLTVRAQSIAVRATSRTHEVWEYFRPWLRWLADVVPAGWPSATVEFDARPLPEPEWRRLAREP